MIKQQVGVTLTPSLWQRVRVDSVQHGVTASRLVDRLLADYAALSDDQRAQFCKAAAGV